MKKIFWKKITSLIVAVSVLVAATGVLPVSASSETGSVGDGHAYLYFTADSLDVESPENCKVAYQVNDGELVYLTSNFSVNWVRFEKSALKPNAPNKITLYTGDANGILDESLSRKDAGTGCCDYYVSVATLALVLPNGKVLENPTITTYSPKDADTALNVENIVAVSSDTRISIGDDQVDRPYKAELEFDLTDIWDGSNDPSPADIPEIKNVSLQIGGTPAERRFVWYSLSQATGYVQITTADKLVNGEMPDDAKKVEATSSVSGDTEYYSFQTAVDGISANTAYAYRVGNDTDGWSPVYTFKTDDYELPYSFIAAADIQIGQLQNQDTVQAEIDGWKNSLSKITELNPEASFLVSLGDQISDAHIQSQYDGVFAPAEIPSIPLAVVYGNHDPNDSWTKHYNMPNTTSYGVAPDGASNYSFVYGDTLFMHVNSHTSCPVDEHIAFLEETMMKHPDVKWRVVIMHHAFFGASAQNSGDWELRNRLAPELSRLGIDVVLDGHQHCYCRSKMMNGKVPNNNYSGNEVVNPDASEVLYVTLNSASGSAYNNAAGTGDYIALKSQEKIPNMTNVEVTENSFAITTYRTNDMTVVDEFTLKREGSEPVVKSVHILTKNATVKAGATQTFAAKALGFNNPSQSVIWSVSGNESDDTTINADGVLSVAGDEVSQDIVVTATSAENSSKYASVAVTVDTNVTTIKVGQGVTYALPTAIDSVNVTEWKTAAGNTVTNIDTSLVGCRYYTAALADGTTAIYRVYVGEYKELMRDDFEAYTQDQYTAAISNQEIHGGKFTKKLNEDGDAAGQRLTKDGENTVLALGPYGNSWGAVRWTPDDEEIGDAFKISVKVRVEDFDPGASSSTTNKFIELRPTGISGIALLARTNSSDDITATQVRHESTTAANTAIDVAWDNSSGKYSMKDYIELTLAGNGVQYSAFLGDTELAHSQLWKGTSVGEGGLKAVEVAKRDAYTATNAVTYVDDFVYSKAIHVSDKLDKHSVTATLTQGDAAAQTAIVTLNMSDGTTKDFTVNYTADTSTIGVKSVDGTIAGFDDTIPVTVTVEKSDVNTIIKDVNATAAGIETATIQKVNNVTSGVAVFAYYSIDNEMAAVKLVPFAESDFTGDVAELDVGLVFPTDAEGGYIKGFVFNSMTNLMPLDKVFSVGTSN